MSRQQIAEKVIFCYGTSYILEKFDFLVSGKSQRWSVLRKKMSLLQKY